MSQADDWLSGSIPYQVGLPSILRIPIPGTGGLCVEFGPRGPVPRGGSTSTLFFQDLSGKRHLRLDYGYNPRTNTVDYHWNQRGVHADFGIADHQKATVQGRVAYQAAKYFKYLGRTWVLAGTTLDVASIVKASSPMRRASEVVGAWALAWAGCKAGGAAGALIGSTGTPLGTALGGVGGCIIGGAAGYRIGAVAGGAVYQWSSSTYFVPLQNVRWP